MAFIRNQLTDYQFGGWYSPVEPGNPAAGRFKGGPWQCGYHVWRFYREALRLSA